MAVPAMPDPAPRTIPPRIAGRAERRLVAALRRGDDAALRDVHHQYGATIFGYLVGVLRDRATAEDVYQQVLMQVWRRGSSYDPARASLATWMLTIARSRAIDALRDRRPGPVDPDVLPEDPAEPFEEAALERWRMAHLLGQLPADERQLLHLRFYEGLSQTEIEARTGIALGTIKTRMVRGLERLRALLDAEEAVA